MLSKAVKLQPDSKEARKLYIATLVGLKQYGRAVAEYDRALQANPNDGDSYYDLGSVYMQIGQGVVQRLSDEPGYAALMRAQHYEPYEEWRSLSLAYRDAISPDTVGAAKVTGFAASIPSKNCCCRKRLTRNSA